MWPKTFFFSFVYNRNDNRPQPKPRLSLVKTPNPETDSLTSQINNSIVQRIKPFFEQSPPILPQESKISKQQQQRQPISIPITYQTGKSSKATCLDDIISSTVWIFIKYLTT